MKNTVDITREMKEKLDVCPNCEGPLEQVNSYAVRCQICGNRYHVETQKERLFWLCLTAGILSFVIGYAIALIFF